MLAAVLAVTATALVPPRTTTSLVRRASEASSPAEPAQTPVVPVVSPKEELVSVVSTSVPFGATASAEVRASVLELLAKLEPSNPTEAPATSPLLNGVWDAVYTGHAPGPLASPTRPLALFLYAGGYTPGEAGLAIAESLPDQLVTAGDLTVTIAREQPRVEASSSVALLGAGARQVKVTATLEAESALRLKETYSSVSVGGRVVEVPEKLRYTRKLFVTYLDDQLLVARDDSGVPSVLLRKEMPDWLEEGVPSTDDDDLAPGAG